MKISLCMICGNEAGVILRCLESAKGAFDELCLVEANGARPPDETLRLAELWCEENGKAFHGEVYQNGRGAEDWEHVDDFAAARNLSFELATGEWILWLDCDDTLGDVNSLRIRDVVAGDCDWTPKPGHTLKGGQQADAIFCTYVIEKHGATILRERLIRRGKGRWKNAIHETCVVEGTSVECPQIVVTHGEHQHKHRSSADRNARILERVLEDSARHYFYWQAELKMLKDPRARAAALKALALLGPEQVEERYTVLLNLSELDPERRQEHLFEAVKDQPHRREAFAYLCQAALNDGRVSDAVSYFRLMDALPMPSPLPWTHQGLWYHGPQGPLHGRNWLRVRVLRASGQTVMAEAEHARFLQDPEYRQLVEGVEQRKVDAA